MGLPSSIIFFFSGAVLFVIGLLFLKQASDWAAGNPARRHRLGRLIFLRNLAATVTLLFSVTFSCSGIRNLSSTSNDYQLLDSIILVLRSLGIFTFYFFQIFRLQQTFASTSYHLSNKTLILLSAMTILSITCEIIGVIFGNYINDNKLLFFIFGTIFCVLLVAMPTIISMLFSNKLLKVMFAMRESAHLFDSAIKLQIQKSTDSSISMVHPYANNNNNNNNSDKATENQDRNENENKNDDSNMENDNKKQNDNGKHVSVVTVELDSIDMPLTPKQEILLDTITKQSLLAYCQTFGLFVAFGLFFVQILKSINNKQIGNIYTTLYPIGIFAFCFVITFSIICIWLSFAFSKKYYQFCCTKTHTRWFQWSQRKVIKKLKERKVNELTRPLSTENYRVVIQ